MDQTYTGFFLFTRYMYVCVHVYSSDLSSYLINIIAIVGNFFLKHKLI